MTHVFLPEHRHGADFVGRADILAIPVGDDALAIGIDGEPQLDDQVLADGLEFGLFAGHQVVAELDGVLVVGDFAGVQAAIDVDEGLESRGPARAPARR